MQDDKDFENSLLNTIAARKLSFDIFIGLGRIKRNVRIKALDIEEKQLILSDRTKIKLSDIRALRFRKEMKKKFLSLLPKPLRESRFEVFLYPHSKEGMERFRWHGSLVHYLVVSDSEDVIMYTKLYITAFSFVKPYPEHLISGDLQSVPVLPGRWREDFREIRRLLLKSSKSPAPCTFVMRDGREFTGVPSLSDFRKNKYTLRLFLPDEENSPHKIFLLANAIEDFWEV